MSSYQLPEDQNSIVTSTTKTQEHWIDPLSEDEDTDSSRVSPQAGSSPLSSPSTNIFQRSSGSKSPQSGSETEKEPSKMSSRSSKQHSPSSSKKDKSLSKASSKSKTDDWTDVTEPEERRRIQNRIAQRKFREKAREQKDRAQRDAQNQQYAGSSYHIPEADELPADEELSGLPWGSINMRHVVARGHATASQQGSRLSDPQLGDNPYLGVYGGAAGGVAPGGYGGYAQMSNFDGRDASSGGDDRYYDSPYYYDYDATSGGSGPGSHQM